jgi:hypothetical protein
MGMLVLFSSISAIEYRLATDSVLPGQMVIGYWVAIIRGK